MAKDLQQTQSLRSFIAFYRLNISSVESLFLKHTKGKKYILHVHMKYWPRSRDHVQCKVWTQLHRHHHRGWLSGFFYSRIRISQHFRFQRDIHTLPFHCILRDCAGKGCCLVFCFIFSLFKGIIKSLHCMKNYQTPQAWPLSHIHNCTTIFIVIAAQLQKGRENQK